MDIALARWYPRSMTHGIDETESIFLNDLSLSTHREVPSRHADFDPTSPWSCRLTLGLLCGHDRQGRRAAFAEAGRASERDFPRAKAGGRSLMARTSRAGKFAILAPRKSGRSATTSGSIRPIRHGWHRSVSGGNAAAALLCGDDGRGSDIMTESHSPITSSISSSPCPRDRTPAFTTAGFSRSRFSTAYGKPKLGFHDCGSLYERAYPRENLSKPPGQWQTYDITLKGKKLTLVWNGKTVYQDHDVRYGETDRDAFIRLNQENAGKPAELQVKLREEAGRYVGYFGEGGTRRASTAPTGRADPLARRPWPRRLSKHPHSYLAELKVG